MIPPEYLPPPGADPSWGGLFAGMAARWVLFWFCAKSAFREKREGRKALGCVYLAVLLAVTLHDFAGL